MKANVQQLVTTWILLGPQSKILNKVFHFKQLQCFYALFNQQVCVLFFVLRSPTSPWWWWSTGLGGSTFGESITMCSTQKVKKLDCNVILFFSILGATCGLSPLWQTCFLLCLKSWREVFPSTSTCFMVGPTSASWTERWTLAPTDLRSRVTVRSEVEKQSMPIRVGEDCVLHRINSFELVLLADYDAPLSEAGDCTPKYHLLRNLFSRYHCKTFLCDTNILTYIVLVCFFNYKFREKMYKFKVFIAGLN